MPGGTHCNPISEVGGSGGATDQFAVTVTAVLGITKVVLTLLALANVTGGVLVQFTKLYPVRVPALIVTVTPAAAGFGLADVPIAPVDITVIA